MQNMLGVRYEMEETKFKSPSITVAEFTDEAVAFPFKYNEDRIVGDLYEYLKSTYGEHYAVEDEEIQCFDAWIAMGDATPTFRNTAIKYLWRYGKKNGNNKKDLMKALHYIVLCLHNDHYKGKP